MIQQKSSLDGSWRNLDDGEMVNLADGIYIVDHKFRANLRRVNATELVAYRLGLRKVPLNVDECQ